jgi:CubicO group peptidase (beta-lactamase class C family)
MGLRDGPAGALERADDHLEMHARMNVGPALIAALTLAAFGSGGQELPDHEGREPSYRPVARFLDHALPDGASGTLVAARDGELLHCRGFGLADRKARVDAGCDTVYDTMSMTKQFTAAAILKLEMMGELRVTDRMTAHIGPVPDDKRRITLHHLLTHTSGLTDAEVATRR